jgi:hypothetical protein
MGEAGTVAISLACGAVTCEWLAWEWLAPE